MIILAVFHCIETFVLYKIDPLKNSHRTNSEFWNNKSTEGWQEEIVGMRTMLESFANIPEGNVKGMRAPFLILGGDEQFEVTIVQIFIHTCWAQSGLATVKNVEKS